MSDPAVPTATARAAWEAAAGLFFAAEAAADEARAAAEAAAWAAEEARAAMARAYQQWKEASK